MFDEVCRELGVEFNRCGQFLCFAARIWEPFMFLSLLYWWWLGLKGVKIIGKDELRRREPGLNPGIAAALFFPSTGVVDPFNLTVAYAENAVKNGVHIRFNSMVQGMTTEDGMITSVQTNRGTIRPKLIINAAGVFCEDIATMADDRFYSIHPRKGTSAVLDKKYSDSLVQTAVSSMKTASRRKKMNSKGGGIIRTIGGNTMVGPDAVETINKEDFSTLAFNVNEIFRNHKKTGPELDEKQIINYFSGIRAATYDEDFIVCKGIYTTNIIHAAGIQSPGLTAAPAIAVDVAHMVADFFGGESFLLPNPEFDPIRKAPPRPLSMSLEERDSLINENPDYGIIVCRCEEISKGEIVEVLRRNVRCHTLDGVKRRVRPGMGRCQGGFCCPLVLDIISSEKRVPYHNISKSGSGSELLFGNTKTLAKKKHSEAHHHKSSLGDKETEELLRKHAKSMLAASLTNRKDDDNG
jgi:glycerol-3-phosphate dehydrogenase